MADVGLELLDSKTDLGGKRLVTWEKADLVIEEYWRSMRTRLELAMRRVNNYRSYNLWKLIERFIFAYEAECKLAIAGLLLPQHRRPKGNQKIIARNWKPKRSSGALEFGTWNGKLAWYRPPGRPPLSRKEWQARYEARKIAKRKGTGTPKDNSLPEPPSTQYPRPTEGNRLGTKNKFQLPRIANTPTPTPDVWDSIIAAMPDEHADNAQFLIAGNVNVDSLKDES